MAKIIGVVSGKGGVGKTISSVNIALALHEIGEEVVVVDADTTASTLGMHLGFYTFSNKLQDVLNNEIDISRAIYMHHTGLKFIPSSIDLESLGADVSRLKSVLSGLEGIVILDAPAGLDRGAISILEACDEVLIITNPEIPTVANAVKISRMAEDMQKNVFGVVLTRVKGEPWEVSKDDVESMCELPLIGMVPEDRSVKMSISEKVPVVAYSPYSPAAIEYKSIAARLVGKTYVAPKYLGLKRFLKLV